MQTVNNDRPVRQGSGGWTRVPPERAFSAEECAGLFGFPADAPPKQAVSTPRRLPLVFYRELFHNPVTVFSKDNVTWRKR